MSMSVRLTLWCLIGLVAQAAAAASLRVEVEDPAGRPVADAVVYALPDKPVSPGDSLKASIDQVDRQFVPRVSVIQTGTSVTFPNSDNIRHSVYSFSPARTFTLKIYSGIPATPVVFDKPGIVVMGCNIHDSMVAWVLVVDTPYFARTDSAGTASLQNLPPGSYKLRAWSNAMRHEAGGEPLEIGSTPLPSRTLHVEPDQPDPASTMPMNGSMEGMSH
jgi:plastocyanin